MHTQTDGKSILDNPTVIKRGISLRRVSTDEQAEKGFSLPTQLKEIQAYAAKNSIELVADFYDDFTGSSLDRPGLTGARQWLRTGRADCIICLDSDRLTREPAHYMLLRDEFNSLGVELHYAKRGKSGTNLFDESG
jgi:site-specific DNA recombinase